VVQVSRWDRLKDMGGVLTGFADHVVGRVEADLALVGPMVDGVADDPEGTEVLAECVALWESLPLARRRRIRLVSLPMLDIDENAVMVNALQRSAAVIVQKSLAEGFGLTVAEGMWKGKPIVASRVGGIIDQVAPGTGILLDDPTDLAAYGDAVTRLLEHPEEIERLGSNARRRVLDDFVGDRHLLQYADLIERLLVR
jgi:trehalose synthase